MRPNDANCVEQKDLKRIIEAQIRLHLEKVLGQEKVTNIQVADIEDFSQWEIQKQGHKYLAKVKVISSVCVPLTVSTTKPSEQVMKQKGTTEEAEMVKAEKAESFEVESVDREQSECTVMLVKESESSEEYKHETEIGTLEKEPESSDECTDVIETVMLEKEPESLECKHVTETVMLEMEPESSDECKHVTETGMVEKESKSSEECKHVTETVMLEKEPESSEDCQQIDETVEFEVSTAITQPEGKLLDVSDFESYNFDADRSEEKFAAGQVWALYDDLDGMPRNYAYINQVRSIKPFDVIVSWLEPKVATGNSVACGEFVVEKKMQPICFVDCFSHVMKWRVGKTGDIFIKPEEGDVWALYKSENLYGHEIVQVVGNSGDCTTLIVTPLTQVPGYRSTFMPQNRSFDVASSDLALFSHNIPSCVLKGENALDFGTVCCLELDPAALLS